MVLAFLSNALLPGALAGDLADELALLQRPDLPTAKVVVENLTQLATTQKGASKAKTERLATAVKNLFTAEYQVAEAVNAGVKSEAEARRLERISDDWMKPNAFGRVNKEASRASLKRAWEVRQMASKQLATAREGLVEQLQEMDSVIDDFHRIGEFEVVLVLVAASDAVAGRSLPQDSFKSAFPKEAVASVREKLRLRERGQANPAAPAAGGSPVPPDAGQKGNHPISPALPAPP